MKTLRMAKVMYRASAEFKQVHFGNAYHEWRAAQQDEQNLFLMMAEAVQEALRQERESEGATAHVKEQLL